MAAACGVLGLALATHALSSSDESCEDAWGIVCSPERMALVTAALLSWCVHANPARRALRPMKILHLPL